MLPQCHILSSHGSFAIAIVVVGIAVVVLAIAFVGLIDELCDHHYKHILLSG